MRARTYIAVMGAGSLVIVAMELIAINHVAKQGLPKHLTKDEFRTGPVGMTPTGKPGYQIAPNLYVTPLDDDDD